MVSRLNSVKEYGRQLTHEIKGQGIVYTKPGSIAYLLWRAQPSKQSISIKYGHVGEKLAMRMINDSELLELPRT